MPSQPTPQECELIADMLDANLPKAAIAKFVYNSESTLRPWLSGGDKAGIGTLKG
jgi:hypothetical protein